MALYSSENLSVWKSGQIVARVFDVIGFLLSLALVFMGYTYGKFLTSQRTPSAPVAVPEWSFAEPTATPFVELSFSLNQEELGPCAPGEQAVSADEYTLCISSDFSTEEDVVGFRRFSRGDEELAVYTSAEQFPLHVCTIERPVAVGGYEGTRIVFHEPNGPGCGGMKGFALRLQTGDQGDYTIHLSRTEGVYETEQVFEDIVQSFDITR